MYYTKQAVLYAKTELIGTNPVVSTRFSISLVWRMSRLTWDGTAEPVSRDQILRRERGQGKFRFPSSVDHEQDWQPSPVDPYSAESADHTFTLFDEEISYRHRIPVVCSMRSNQKSALRLSLSLLP